MFGGTQAHLEGVRYKLGYGVPREAAYSSGQMLTTGSLLSQHPLLHDGPLIIRQLFTGDWCSPLLVLDWFAFVPTPCMEAFSPLIKFPPKFKEGKSNLNTATP